MGGELLLSRLSLKYLSGKRGDSTVMDDHFSANWNNLKKIPAAIQVIFLSFRLETEGERTNQLSHDLRRWLFSLSNGFHVGLMQEGNPQNKVFY